MGNNVIIGMSGGVDSSVAAYLLKEQGYNVTGVTMQMWEGEADTPVTDAAAVAERIGIPHKVLNFRKEFKQHVIDYFVDAYTHGQTPNPCVVCNRFVKWEALLNYCDESGADYVATGHYAKITRLPNNRYAICNSVSAAKDQTYALYNLTQEQLQRTLMPIGDYTKDEIRSIAERLGITVANKPDSMEICFIPDNDYASYITSHSSYRDVPGNFVDTKGNIIGQHRGIIHYTVGQRKGLGLSLGYPVFVAAIRPDTNEVVIGSNDEVFSSTLYADKVNLMGVDRIEDNMRAVAKIRYSHAGAPCTLNITKDDILQCVFDEPQRAVTPGQSVVFYRDNYVLGGGTII